MAFTHVNAQMTSLAVHKYSDTESTAIASTTQAADQAQCFVSLTLNLSAAPTTSENFVITLDSRLGVTYDTVLYSQDLSVGSVTDLVLSQDDIDIVLFRGDALAVTWTNTDGRTWGMEVTTVEGA